MLNNRPSFEYSRQIVVGSHSKVWAALSVLEGIRAAGVIAIGHKELRDFDFRSDDLIWIFSYSKSAVDNTRLLQALHDAGAVNVAYISSASTNVTSVTRCYTYPHVKKLAQQDAARICRARTVNIGWLYTTAQELPAGLTAATSANELASFMLHPTWAAEGLPTNLFRLIERPFTNTIERALFSAYGVLMLACGRYPCLLRPIDVVLRALNMRWYGYLYLSNKLWSTTIS